MFYVRLQVFYTESGLDLRFKALMINCDSTQEWRELRGEAKFYLELMCLKHFDLHLGQGLKKTKQ